MTNVSVLCVFIVLNTMLTSLHILNTLFFHLTVCDFMVLPDVIRRYAAAISAISQLGGWRNLHIFISLFFLLNHVAKLSWFLNCFFFFLFLSGKVLPPSTTAVTNLLFVISSVALVIPEVLFGAPLPLFLFTTHAVFMSARQTDKLQLTVA